MTLVWDLRVLTEILDGPLIASAVIVNIQGLRERVVDRAGFTPLAVASASSGNCFVVHTVAGKVESINPVTAIKAFQKAPYQTYHVRDSHSEGEQHDGAVRDPAFLGQRP